MGYCIYTHGSCEELPWNVGMQVMRTTCFTTVPS